MRGSPTSMGVPCVGDSVPGFTPHHLVATNSNTGWPRLRTSTTALMSVGRLRNMVTKLPKIISWCTPWLRSFGATCLTRSRTILFRRLL